MSNLPRSEKINTQWTCQKAVTCITSEQTTNSTGKYYIFYLHFVVLPSFTLIYSIDATSESGRFGRLVNHSRSMPNLQTKVITFRKQPRLILVIKKSNLPSIIKAFKT
jgi:hypothetical protein